MLIGITGAKGSGKDTLGKYYRNRGFALVKFADPLKNMLRSLYREAGVDPKTIERKIEEDLKETDCEILCGRTPRHAMQTLGTEWRDMISMNLWREIFHSKVRTLLTEGTPVVCSDVRFQHEVDLIKELGGYIVRVDRPGAGGGDGHISETEMNQLEVNYIVSNLTSITDLQNQGKRILDELFAQTPE